MAAPTGSYECDTLPAARLASGSSPEPELTRSPSPPAPESITHLEALKQNTTPDHPSSQPSPRKLCVRHQRMADEGTNLKLQQSLDALPVQEREIVNSIWSNFSSSSHPRRELILQGLLTMCCFSQLSLLTEQLGHLIRIDPFTVLPREVSLKVLAHLDATSLCRAAQVSRQWRSLADDDILWRGICEQHIGQKCLKCGWGLPILERKRTAMQLGAPSPSSLSPLPSSKRQLENSTSSARPMKRQRSEPDSFTPSIQASSSSTSLAPPKSDPRPSTPSDLLLTSSASDSKLCDPVTRPWKDVYSERLTVERNWRRGRCTVRTLKGHTDGVMCLQFSESLTHPSFPILITGSYDRTIRVWNLETGLEVRCLRGHTRAVRALQFDECKLITGSMDHTIRVWNWRSGECIRTLEGHTEGVVCLNYDSNVLASGSVDSTVKVWNFRTGEAFTLRGHRDWVNAVRLWDSGYEDSSIGVGDLALGSADISAPQICSGKMLFSASDDGTIKLWDLARRSCVRQFTGHVGQVQSLKLLEVDEGCDEDGPSMKAVVAERIADNHTANVGESNVPEELFTIVTHDGGFPIVRASSETTEDIESLAESARKSLASRSSSTRRSKKPVLMSGSLDNTIKFWDIETGKATQTLFGHIEGVWAVASDKLRLLSGSHDRTIKVWNREEGRCTATLFGHRGAVTCLGLGEDKIVSGSDDGDVRIWSFSG
ncbi:WD40 repeat-like protein [Hygrophoropsis aurantiaca]|uniref:WD40 repeat-like protein n=1 Tax=Hygrophoropsis aurantiaca TaxID=72124 RepID=A0ACB8AUA5_9AGAM|nr:WD40 repeat-like protein [Hygrophoropsis aurantiaca]